MCNGKACGGTLPGMGGVNGGKNFMLNCSAWKEYHAELSSRQIEEAAEKLSTSIIHLGPMTGAQENMGWNDEKSFYKPFIKAVYKSGVRLSIGDGCPDEKLLSGIEAVKALEDGIVSPKAAAFFKPYPDQMLFQRMDWASGISDIVGIDTDAYNILTMRNKVHLEKKTATQLNNLRNYAKRPFAIKGVFTSADMELVKEFKPEIAIVSNHGGRVETETGSTAAFLKNHAKELRNYCGQIWVDGGIRTKQDIITALAIGADHVMLGRPFITAFFRSQENGVTKMIQDIIFGEEK